MYYRSVLELLSRFAFLKSLPLQSIFHVLPSELSKNQYSSVFTEKKERLFSVAFKGLHYLAPISIQAFILPILTHKPYVLLLYQTSQWSNEAPGSFQSVSLCLECLSHFFQSASKIQFQVLMKHFLSAPHLSWI